MDIRDLRKLRTFLYDAYWPPFTPNLTFSARRGAELCRAANADSVRFGSIGKYAFYPSRVYPPHPELGGRDLLQEMIDTGIKVVAYIPVGHAVPGCWTRQLYPQWICRDDQGGEMEPESQASHFGGERLVSICAFGDYWDKVQQVVDEIIAHDIVAVYLDGPYQGWGVEDRICQCDACRQRYMRETGRALPRNDEPERWDEYQLWKRRHLLELLQIIHAKAAARGLPLMMNRTAAAFLGTSTELAMLAEVDCFLIESSRGGIAGASLAHTLDKMIWNYTNSHAHHPRRSDAQFEAATLACGRRTLTVGGSPIVSYAGRFFRSDRHLGAVATLFHEAEAAPASPPERFACVFYPDNERLRATPPRPDEASARYTDMLAARGIPVMELPEALLGAVSGEPEWSSTAALLPPEAIRRFKVIFVSRDVALTPRRQAWLEAFVASGGTLLVSGQTPPDFAGAHPKMLDERLSRAFTMQRWGTQRYDSYLLAPGYEWMPQTECVPLEFPGAQVMAQSVIFDRQGEMRWDSVFAKSHGKGRIVVFDSPIEQLLSEDSQELCRFVREVAFAGLAVPFEVTAAETPVTASVREDCVVLTAPRETLVSYILDGQPGEVRLEGLAVLARPPQGAAAGR